MNIYCKNLIRYLITLLITYLSDIKVITCDAVLC